MKFRFILALATLFFFAACAAPITTPTPTPFTLADTKWTLTGITENGVIKKPVAGTDITLEFSRDNRVNGHAGCNSFGGAYETQGEILKISALFSTLMACIEVEKMEMEAAFLAALQNAQLFEKRDKQLTITFASGSGKLEFTAR